MALRGLIASRVRGKFSLSACQADRAGNSGRGRLFASTNDYSIGEEDVAAENDNNHGLGSQPYSKYEAVVGALQPYFTSGGQGLLRLSTLHQPCMPFPSGVLAGIWEGTRGMHSVRCAHTSSEEWLVQRAKADRKRREARNRRIQTRPKIESEDDISVGDSGGGYVNTNATSEEKLAAVLGRPDLIITRNVEWANLAFGFEQQNKYVIMDPREPQAPVGYILEDSNILMRQFLRRRRPFIALVLDAYGNEVCRVRRPVWLINSTIYVEVGGQVIGEAHRRWHLWRRIYDVYLGTKQFATVENPGFWYWTFDLRNENKGLLAVIDRNWRGFGYEFLTDAGQYAVRFGDSIPGYTPLAYRPESVMDTVRVKDKPVLAGSPSGLSEMQNLQTAAEEAEDLDVERPLTLTERAVTLALAVSLDNDYFSNHSSGMGFFPLPFFGGGSEIADADTNLPMDRDDEPSYPYESSHTPQGVPTEPPEPLERIIASDDTAGDFPDSSWTADNVVKDNVVEDIFGESPTDSWTEPQDNGDIFGDPSDFFGSRE